MAERKPEQPELSTEPAELLAPGEGNPGYLTYGIALLGLIGSWRNGGYERQMGIFWTIAIGIFYLMALGPEVMVGDKSTGVPMPYSLLQYLPVFSIGRDPGRFQTIAMLGIGLLTAFGLRFIFDRVRSLTRRQARFALFSTYNGVITALLVGAFLVPTLYGFMAATGEVKIDQPDWPNFYKQIANDEEVYSILELPPFTEKGRGENHYMMYQVLHNKPRFSGRWARDHKLTNPNNFVKNASFFRHFWLLDFSQERIDYNFPERDFLKRTDYRTQGVPILNYTSTRYIILYKEAISPDIMPRYTSLMKQVFGESVSPYYEDGLMTVYKVPDAQPAADPITLDVGEGWFASEVRGDGVVFRLADIVNIEPTLKTDLRPAELYTMNLTKQPIRAKLSFMVSTFKEPRTLDLAINGYPLATIQLKPEENPKSVSLDITLPTGNNKITLGSPEPPLPTGNPNDNRLLSFGVYTVELNAR